MDNRTKYGRATMEIFSKEELAQADKNHAYGAKRFPAQHARAAASILPILGGGSLLSTVGTVAIIGGSILSGVSAYAAAQYHKEVGEMNAKVAEENATRARERAAIEAQEQDTPTSAVLGAQLATQSASGLSVTGRSQMLTRKAARELGRKDALNIRQAGEIEAYNYGSMPRTSAHRRNSPEAKAPARCWAASSASARRLSVAHGAQRNPPASIPGLRDRAVV